MADESWRIVARQHVASVRRFGLDHPDVSMRDNPCLSHSLREEGGFRVFATAAVFAYLSSDASGSVWARAVAAPDWLCM